MWRFENQLKEGISASKARSSQAKLALQLAGSCAAFLAASILGLNVFRQADLIALGDRSSNDGRGWSFSHLIGITAWSYACPVACALLLSLISVVYKLPGLTERHRTWAVVGALVTAVVLILTGLFTFNAHHLVSCGYVMCGSRLPTLRPNSFDQNMGSIIFFLSFMMFAIMLVLFQRSSWTQPEVWKGLNAMVTSAAARAVMTRRLTTAGLLIILPLMVVVAGILPSSYEDMNVVGIAEYSSLFLTGEVSGAWMTTVNWFWSPSFICKVYPDIALFYGYLEVIVVFSALMVEFPTLKRAVSHRFGHYSLRFILLGTWSLIFFILFGFYWGHDHLYSGGKSDKLETFSRTCGVVSSMLMGLSLLPAAKSSPFLSAAGISWESGVWLHIILGVLCSATAVGHVLGYFFKFAQLGCLSSLLPLNAWFQYTSSNNWTIPFMAAVFWPATLCYGLFPWIRRTKYELFRYTHNFGLVLVPATLWHGAHAWNYLIPGVAIWLIDYSIRFLRATEKVQVKEFSAHILEAWIDPAPGCPPQPSSEKITKISFTWPGQSRAHSPGMHVYANFPQLSLTEWHPFSVSSSPLDGLTTLHIKNMGCGTFTGRLHDLAQLSTEETAENVIVNIDGPHGPHLSLNHSSMLLIAGGIGITPMISVTRFLVQKSHTNSFRRVHLVWTARSATMFDMMREELSVMDEVEEGLPFELKVSLYCSTAKEKVSCSLGMVLPGMPHFPDLLANEVLHGDFVVRVCGPPPMVSECEAASEALGVDFEVWSFTL